MKNPVILTLLTAAIAFATRSELGYIAQSNVGGGHPGTDDNIVSQPFDYSSLTNAFGCSSNYGWMLADDFTATGVFEMETMETWMIYFGANPSQINFQVRNDTAGPGPSILYSDQNTILTHTNTGMSSWGYPLWHTQVVFDEPSYVTEAGIKVWLAVQVQGDTSFWLVCNQLWADECYFSEDDGTSWMSSTYTWGMAYECFFTLAGRPYAGLAPATWGSIKALF